jgi:hypothetical protein
VKAINGTQQVDRFLSLKVWASIALGVPLIVYGSYKLVGWLKFIQAGLAQSGDFELYFFFIVGFYPLSIGGLFLGNALVYYRRIAGTPEGLELHVRRWRHTFIVLLLNAAFITFFWILRTL